MRCSAHWRLRPGIPNRSSSPSSSAGRAATATSRSPPPPSSPTTRLRQPSPNVSPPNAKSCWASPRRWSRRSGTGRNPASFRWPSPRANAARTTPRAMPSRSAGTSKSAPTSLRESSGRRRRSSRWPNSRQPCPADRSSTTPLSPCAASCSTWPANISTSPTSKTSSGCSPITR